MSIYSGPWDAKNSDRRYDAGIDMGEFFAGAYVNGSEFLFMQSVVIQGYLEELTVTCSDGKIRVGTGAAYLTSHWFGRDGNASYLYMENDEPLILDEVPSFINYVVLRGDFRDDKRIAEIFISPQSLPGDGGNYVHIPLAIVNNGTVVKTYKELEDGRFAGFLSFEKAYTDELFRSNNIKIKHTGKMSIWVPYLRNTGEPYQATPPHSKIFVDDDFDEDMHTILAVVIKRAWPATLWLPIYIAGYATSDSGGLIVDPDTGKKYIDVVLYSSSQIYESYGDQYYECEFTVYYE